MHKCVIGMILVLLLFHLLILNYLEMRMGTFTDIKLSCILIMWAEHHYLFS